MVPLYEVYESTKYIHLLLPYLEGGELFEKIKAKTKYKEGDAKHVMNQFLSALAYLAERKVVHRDLKPENLILAKPTDDSDLLIADFGFATFIEDDKPLYLRCGSPGYVAPEVLSDEGYGVEADVFSSGVIMFVLLTGRPLFRGEKVDDILEKNKNCELIFPDQLWSKISPDARDLCEKLLKRDPKERITAKDALQHPWFTNSGDDGPEIEMNQLQAYEKCAHDKPSGQNPDLKLVTATPVMAGRKLAD